MCSARCTASATLAGTSAYSSWPRSARRRGSAPAQATRRAQQLLRRLCAQRRGQGATNRIIGKQENTPLAAVAAGSRLSEPRHAIRHIRRTHVAVRATPRTRSGKRLHLRRSKGPMPLRPGQIAQDCARRFERLAGPRRALASQAARLPSAPLGGAQPAHPHQRASGCGQALRGRPLCARQLTAPDL